MMGNLPCAGIILGTFALREFFSACLPLFVWRLMIVDEQKSKHEGGVVHGEVLVGGRLRKSQCWAGIHGNTFMD